MQYRFAVTFGTLSKSLYKMGQDFLDIQYCITTLCLSEMLCICCEVLAGNETLDFLALSTWKFNLGNSFQIPAHPPTLLPDFWDPQFFRKYNRRRDRRKNVLGKNSLN